MPKTLWLRLLIVAVVGGGAWWALRPRYLLKIVVNRGSVKIHCGAAKAWSAELMDLLRGLPLQGKVTILGVRDAQGRTRIAFRGRIDAGMRQRIRNYLKSKLL